MIIWHAYTSRAVPRVAWRCPRLVDLPVQVERVVMAGWSLYVLLSDA